MRNFSYKFQTNFKTQNQFFTVVGKDGWQYWFSNSSDAEVRRLLRSLEFVDDVEEGLGNVTTAFFWGYAFLGSRAQLQYMVTNNMTMA